MTCKASTIYHPALYGKSWPTPTSVSLFDVLLSSLCLRVCLCCTCNPGLALPPSRLGSFPGPPFLIYLAL